MLTLYTDLTLRQLDWCIAQITGVALRPARVAKVEDVAHLAVPFRMFETVTTIVNGKTMHAVSPITVTRFGKHPSGGAAVTIDFMAADGRRGWGTVPMFYDDEEEARLHAQGCTHGFFQSFHPTTNPVDGLAVRELVDGRLELKRWTEPDVSWRCQLEVAGKQATGYGETELVAFGRAFVRAHLGETIDILPGIA